MTCLFVAVATHANADDYPAMVGLGYSPEQASEKLWEAIKQDAQEWRTGPLTNEEWEAIQEEWIEQTATEAEVPVIPG